MSQYVRPRCRVYHIVGCNELMQGSTVEVTFSTSVDNKCNGQVISEEVARKGNGGKDLWDEVW